MRIDLHYDVDQLVQYYPGADNNVKHYGTVMEIQMLRNKGSAGGLLNSINYLILPINNSSRIAVKQDRVLGVCEIVNVDAKADEENDEEVIGEQTEAD